MGVFFLPEPPEEEVPLPDFKRMADGGVRKPNPELIDTIQICQRRQRWYREYVVGSRSDTLPFVGAADVGDQPAVVAGQIRTVLKLEVGAPAAKTAIKIPDAANEHGISTISPYQMLRQHDVKF